MGLFKSKPTPIVNTPIKEVEPPKTTSLDPDHGESVGNTKRQREAISKRAGRNKLKIGLRTTSDVVRTGISIS